MARNVRHSARRRTGAHLYTQRTAVQASAPVGAHVYPVHSGLNSSGTFGKKSNKHRPRPLAPVLVIVAILLAFYFLGFAVFNFVVYPRSVLNGDDISLQPASEVASSVATSVANHVLSVSDSSGFSMEIKGSDVDLKFNDKAFAASIISQQNPWLWPIAVFSSHDIAPIYESSFDEDSLKDEVDSAVDSYNQKATQSTDATMAYDNTSSTFAIVAEKQGTALNSDVVEAQVSDALQVFDSTLVLTDDAYIHPSVTSDDANLQTAVSQANALLGATQSLTVGGTQVAEVTKDQLASWLTINDDFSVSVDTDAITAWAQGEFSSQLDSVSTTRNYTTPDGSSYTVSGGTYGWNIDGASLADSISSAIESGSAGTIEIPMKQTASVWAPGAADWGSRWIDINLTTQHAKLYDNGSVTWESDIVSGNSAKGYDTPTGVYSIDSYMTSTASSGSRVKLISPEVDAEGNPTYTSYVDYWIPFIGNLVALHDATWRSSFGGTIYQTNGSHGCVNLPASAAASLYSLVKVGDVVVVHD